MENGMYICPCTCVFVQSKVSLLAEPMAIGSKYNWNSTESTRSPLFIEIPKGGNVLVEKQIKWIYSNFFYCSPSLSSSASLVLSLSLWHAMQPIKCYLRAIGWGLAADYSKHKHFKCDSFAIQLMHLSNKAIVHASFHLIHVTNGQKNQQLQWKREKKLTKKKTIWFNNNKRKRVELRKKREKCGEGKKTSAVNLTFSWSFSFVSHWIVLAVQSPASIQILVFQRNSDYFWNGMLNVVSPKESPRCLSLSRQQSLPPQ